jgi:hypothetical protein
VPQTAAQTRMTAAELAGGIKRAHVLCDAEVSAAREEYEAARRPIAARRKARASDARLQRDAQIQKLRDQFARDRQQAP